MKCETCGKDYSESPLRAKCSNEKHWDHQASYLQNYFKQEEIKSIVGLLTHPAGFDIACSTLECRRSKFDAPPNALEVLWHPNGTAFCRERRIFNAPEEAAKFFVEKRHEMKLGLDLEKQ